MASWMVHLRIADRLLEIVKDLEPTEFVVGNIAPDSGVPNEDWSVFTPSTNVSHFRKTDKFGKKEIVLECYVDRYFSEKQRANYDAKQYSFYLGYYVHLVTDMLWKTKIFEGSVEKDKGAYEKDPTETVWKWKKDWYDLDFLYLRDYPEFRAFKIYEQAAGFKNKYMEIFSEDAFDNRRVYITGFYHEKRENLDRKYPWLNKEEMDDFVETAVENIIGKIDAMEVV